jgi:metal-dependent hydrolase (beta-lactamase superfamily II)
MNFIDWIKSFFTHTVDSVVAEFHSAIAKLEELERVHANKAVLHAALAGAHDTEAAKATKIRKNLEKIVN